MKLLTILLTALITSSALATCNEAYQVINLKTRKKASSLSTTASAMPPTAAGFFTTSYQLAATGVTSGAGGVVSATTMVGMTYGSPLVTSTSVFNLYRATQYLWVKDILDQSLIGFGKDLVGFSEELESKLGKEVSVEELSYVINEANEQELFCKAGVKQYTPGEFSDYVEETLKRSL